MSKVRHNLCNLDYVSLCKYTSMHSWLCSRIDIFSMQRLCHSARGTNSAQLARSYSAFCVILTFQYTALTCAIVFNHTQTESYKFTPWFFSTLLQVYMSHMIPILQKRNSEHEYPLILGAGFLSFAIYSPLYDLICCPTCSAQLENSVSKQTLW